MSFSLSKQCVAVMRRSLKDLNNVKCTPVAAKLTVYRSFSQTCVAGIHISTSLTFFSFEGIVFEESWAFR